MPHIAKNVMGKEENRNTSKRQKYLISCLFTNTHKKDNRIKWILKDEMIIEIFREKAQN